MPCTYCNVQFTITKWKSTCNACNNKFCSDCHAGKLCKTCREIHETHFIYDDLMKVKVKELKNYMQFRQINVSPYREKPELVRALLAVEGRKMGNNKSKVRDSKTGNQQSFYPRQAPNHPQPYSQQQPNHPHPNPTGSYPHEAHLPNYHPNFSNHHATTGSYPHEPPTRHNNSFPSNAFTPQRNDVSFGNTNSAPVFHPTDDVPPTYRRTQNDFPTASIFMQQQQSSTITTATITSNTEKPQESTTASGDDLKVTDKEQHLNDDESEKITKPVGTGINGKIILSDMSSVDQVPLLTNKEMKQILADNFVDFKGCVEKIEFQDKVKALYKDYHKNNEEMQQSNSDDVPHEDQDEKVCKICWDATIDCVFLECGHMATCTTCGKRLNECPICRQFIVRCVHVFRT